MARLSLSETDFSDTETETASDPTVDTASAANDSAAAAVGGDVTDAAGAAGVVGAGDVADAVDAADEVCQLKHASAEAVREVRRTLVSDRAAAALAATFSVLGDPTRVRLLDALARRELCVCELAELIGSSDSAVSHQLRLLRSLRLVRSRRSGRMMYYRLDDDHIRLLLDQSRRHIEETHSRS